MYINKVDDLLDKILDDFYNNVILKDKRVSKIFKQVNFVQSQREINDIMKEYIKTINMNDISDITSKGDNANIIVEIIKRYVAYYLFSCIIFFYIGKQDTFVNNIIEFTKNQSNYGYKIDNFFNNESNATIINFFNLIKNILKLLEVGEDKDKKKELNSKPSFQEAIKFLNELGQEFVNTSFQIATLKNIHAQCHNIVKTIILLLIYKRTEKKNVYDMLESVEKEDREYVFIDVILPKTQYIDFSVIENVLTKKEINQGMAHYIWEYMLKLEQEKMPDMSDDSKILSMINKGLLIPIVDDFLLYHKDNEKYDKNVTDPTKIKKKEDTKIRYIVGKIDNTSDYYSDIIQKNPTAKQNIKKNFYTPLTDRKAILINNTEEVKIINKILNQGRRSIENSEYYNDLILYRQYPYINFKDFQQYGFHLQATKTVDAVRYVSFERSKEHNDAGNTYPQMRIGSKGQILNIVGFIIPSYTRPLECIKMKNIIDIHTLSRSESDSNGIKLVIKQLTNNFKKKKNSTAYSWIIDLEKDNAKLETYEQVGKFNEQDLSKKMGAVIYDEFIKNVYQLILDKLNKSTAISLYDAFKIVNSIENKYLPISLCKLSLYDVCYSELYNSLESTIYTEKYIKALSKYDNKEDILYGFGDNVIILPVAPPPKIMKTQIIKIKMDKQESPKKIGKTDDVKGAICQHHVTWENLLALRKKDPNKHQQLLYEFIQQYLVEDNDRYNICKSCGFEININKYITDMTFDDETQKPITYAAPLEVPLEEMLEYEKYKVTIRNIDKIIEKIAIIANIPYYVGISHDVKWRRKSTTKNIIDILLLNNKNLKKDFNNRRKSINKLYGLNPDMSNIFIFDLDDDIFVYSSKEKDYYKKIKKNNIIVYTVINMMLELNDSQISFMTGDKTCNFIIFSKYGLSLFDNLKIRKNNAGDTDDIKNYPVLCYMIYLVSCLLTKYNMWQQDDQHVKGKKKFDPVVQKTILHTIVDILNSVLEVATIKDISYLYDIISTKFYYKLTTTFNNLLLLNKIKKDDIKFSTMGEKKKFILTKFKPMELVGYFEQLKYDTDLFTKQVSSRYYPLSRQLIRSTYYYLNNLTNCPSGSFHEWVAKNKTMKCKLCGTILSDVKFDKELTENIIKEYHYIELHRLAKKYCNDGKLHSFIYRTNDQCKTCQLCHVEENYEFKKKELDDLERHVYANKIQSYESQNENIEKAQKKNEKYENITSKIINALKSKYGESKTQKEEYFKFIDTFLSVIQNTVGTSIIIGNVKTLLSDNVYIFDHDHLGYPLTDSIVISDKDNKIQYKQNHPFYKTDVLFYTSYKTGKIDVYYDSKTLVLLGYKEANKDYVSSKKADRKVKINYSLFNKLKYLGYPERFIDIKNKVESVISTFGKIDSEEIIREVISMIGRERIQNLKQVINIFEVNLHKLYNNYIEKSPLSDKDKIDKNKNKFDKSHIDKVEFLDKYYKKLANMTIYNNNKKKMIMKRWKIVTNNIFFKNLNNKTINLSITSNVIPADDAITYDYHGNLILFYIVHEMKKLIHYNTNKVVKGNIIYFLVDFINEMFEKFNNESRFNIMEIKRFKYMLESSKYVYDIEQKGHGIDEYTTGFYGDYADEETSEDEEEKIDAKEEKDALDLDPFVEPDADNAGDDAGEYFNMEEQYDQTQLERLSVYSEFSDELGDRTWNIEMENPVE